MVTNWLIDAHSGRTAVEPKDSIKAALGRSPDLADALMLSGLGDEYIGGSMIEGPYLPSQMGALSHAAMLDRAERGGPQRQDEIDDLMGDSSFFVRDREQLLAAGQSEHWHRRHVNPRFRGW